MAINYQVLARKWRPQRFEEVVGQQHVLTALVNSLNQGRLHHAYLFSGTRGVGKTSIARLLAKALNCETGITAEPCGVCTSCQEIEQGRFVDLLEIDAASRTKVEDTRELLDNVQYQPARGRFKVYLIDEVHMLSRHSFNALLKTLEEPPPHVKFLLATTDPQKLPITILSRCLQFHLKSLEPELIDGQLQHILQQEHLPFEATATAALARAADGSLRDALSLADQALAFGNGEVLLSQVETMLGNLNRQQLLTLIDAIVAGEGQRLLSAVAELASQGPDYDQVHKELIGFWHQLALAQVIPAQSPPYAEELNRLAPLVSAEQIQLYYQISLQGRKDLPFAPDGRSALEMTLLRALAFAADTPVGSAPPMPAPAVSPAPITEPVSPKKPEPPTSLSTTPANSEVADEEQVAANLAQEQAEILQQAAHMAPQHAAATPAPAMPSLTPTVTRDEPEPAAPPNEVVDEAAAEVARIRRLLQTRNRLRSQITAEVPAAASQPAEVRAPKPVESKPADSKPMPPSRAEAKQAPPAPRVSTDSSGNQASSQQSELPPLDAYGDLAWQEDEREDLPPWAQEEMPPAPSSTLAPSPAPPRTPQPPPAATPSTHVSQKPTAPARGPVTQAEYSATQAQPLVPSSLLPQAEDEWARLVAQLPIGGLVRQLAMHSSLAREGEQWQLSLAPGHRHLLNEKAQQELTELISTHVGASISLQIQVAEQSLQQTPFEIERVLYQAAVARAKDEIKADDGVQFLISRFAAELDDDSIEPMAT